MNNSVSNTFCDTRSFPDFVTNLAAENAKMYNTRQSYNGQGGYNMKYYNYYQSTPYVSQMYGNCYQKQRYTPYPNRSNGGPGGGPSNCTASNPNNQSSHCQPQQQYLQPTNPNASSSCQQVTNKSLNSSLNSSSYSDSGKNSTFFSSSNNSGCSSPHHSSYSMDSAGTASTSSSGMTGTGTCSGSGSSASVSPLPAQQPGTQPHQQPVAGAALQAPRAPEPEQKEMVVLQISNLDASIDELKMQQFLLCQLKPITPVISLTIESPSLAKVKVPSAQCAKQVVANLHRKKIGHKRMVVSYIKDPSSAESSALRCQVAGLLKDVPFYSLPINRFRELFQSRFKSSISVLDLYRMQDVCTVTLDKNDEKLISLQPDLIDTLKNSALVETSQHSVPYCMHHFQQEKEKGWAEQEIEPLPSVMMSISQLQSLVYSLLKSHKNDIPVASVLYCIEHELQIKIIPNENGVPLEHLLCCIRGVQIANNSYGIKVLSWMDHEQNSPKDTDDGCTTNLRYMPRSPSNEFLQNISREVVELIKMSPKSTMKFTRFIPAYHNHLGKQCRVADYGYTRLIELFEALSPVVQVMGDGENRHITLTHRTQIRRFTNDLLKILRHRPNKSLLLSQLAMAFSQSQNRMFDVTDYGVCDIFDIVDGLVYSNTITTKVYNDNDVLISIVKRKQTALELQNMVKFAGEVVEMFAGAPFYSILFKKFVRSYYYHFGYQCRLSDYGMLKLADLIDAVSGILEMEQSNDEDRKIYFNYQLALRVFADQVQEIIKEYTNNPKSKVRLIEILNIHKTKYGYQLQPNCFGCSNMYDAMKVLPYTDMFESDGEYMVMSFLEDPLFRRQTNAACVIVVESQKDRLTVSELLRGYQLRFKDSGPAITDRHIFNMKHALLMEMDKGIQTVTLTPLMKFVVRMVRVLKYRTQINVYDLKQALNVTLETCFEFGFPSVSSVLNYFGDVFVSSNACKFGEQSDVRLNRDCILSNVSFPGDGRPTLSCNRSGSANPASSAKQPAPDPRCRPGPASSGGNIGANPLRNLGNANFAPQLQIQTFGHNSSMHCFKPLQPQQQQHQQQLPLQPQHQQIQMQPLQSFVPLQPSQLHNQQQQQPSMNPYFTNNANRSFSLSMASGYGNSGILSSTMLGQPAPLPSVLGGTQSMGLRMNMSEITLDKENINPVAGASGAQTNYRAKFPSTGGPEQLVNAFQSQCSLRASGSNGPFTHTSQSQFQGAANLPMPQNHSASLQAWKGPCNQVAQSSQWNSILDLLSKYCEPPKPDTPPAMDLPYWLDPTWSDTVSFMDNFAMCSDPNKLLNIPIPELKTFSNLPPLDSPHILLSEKSSPFTFDQDK